MRGWLVVRGGRLVLSAIDRSILCLLLAAQRRHCREKHRRRPRRVGLRVWVG